MLTLSFLATFGVTLVASCLGQGITLWFIGRAAHRAQLKRAHEIQQAVNEAMAEHEATMRKERDRIQRYAKMEG